MHEYAIKYAKPQFNPQNVTTFKDYPEANIISMLKYHAPGFKYRWIGMVVYGVVGIFGYNQIFLGKKSVLSIFCIDSCRAGICNLESKRYFLFKTRAGYA